MDDEKAVGMTTDAKPLPFRVPLTEGEQGLILQMADFTRGYVPSAWTDTVMVLRLIATIAQQAEQIAERDATIARISKAASAVLTCRVEMRNGRSFAVYKHEMEVLMNAIPRVDATAALTPKEPT